MSFDVVSPFTSVPVDHATDLICDLFESTNNYSPASSQLSSQDIKTGFEICSNATVFFFSFRDVLYQQMFGILPWILHLSYCGFTLPQTPETRCCQNTT